MQASTSTGLVSPIVFLKLFFEEGHLFFWCQLVRWWKRAGVGDTRFAADRCLGSGHFQIRDPALARLWIGHIAALFHRICLPPESFPVTIFDLASIRHLLNRRLPY